MIYGYMLKNKPLELVNIDDTFNPILEFADQVVENYSIFDRLLTERYEIIIEKENLDIKYYFTKIWDSIKRFFQKIIEAFKRFMLNVNYFKNAELPKKQSDDLQFCLNLMKPRTLDGIDKIIRMFNEEVGKYHRATNQTVNTIAADRSGRNYAGLEKLNQLLAQAIQKMAGENSGMDFNSDMEFELGKTITEVNECMEALHNSDQYKRLTTEENQYSDEDKVTIPMNNIITDMKDAQKGLSEITHQLSIAERGIKGLSESADQKVMEVQKKMVNMVTTACKKLIEYYQERIKLLGIYFKSAKASLAALKNNLKDKGYSVGANTKSAKLKTSIGLSSQSLSELKDLMKAMGKNNKDRDWGAYRENFSKMIKILHADPQDTIYIPSVTVSGGSFVYYRLKNPYKKVEVSGKTLYHHRYDTTGIKALYPSACLSGNIGKANFLDALLATMYPDTFFPEPRVYCHLGVALDKASLEFGKQAGGSKGYLYKVINSEQYSGNVYVDAEQAKTAVFIITENDIPVEEIDANEINTSIRNAM